MCYAIPGKIKGFEGKFALIDYFGEERKAYNELDDLRLGDYIYAQGGYVIERIPPAQAKDVLKLWKEVFFKLQKVDVRLSRLEKKSKISSKLTAILDKINHGLVCSRQDYLFLLSLRSSQDKNLLFKNANFLRHKYHQNGCCVHGIIEISNICRRDCLYCGISKRNKSLKRYRMSREEIIAAAGQAIKKYGFKAIVLQSGEDCGFKIEELASIIKEIRKKYPCLIFISFGEIGLNNLKVLFKAGARGLLLRFETSNPKLYQQINPGYRLATRLAHIKEAYRLGYLIATGSLIGIPGQTQGDVLNDVLLAQKLHAEMYSFGPFIPHKASPLKYNAFWSDDEIIKIISLIRIIDQKNGKIVVTTALETMSRQGRRKGLLAGANSVMLNVTPLSYRKLYLIYPGRAHEEESIALQIKNTISLLRSLGRAPTDLGIK